MSTQLSNADSQAKASNDWARPYAGKGVHMVGVGGSGMQALAALLLRCGAVVSGSDLSASEATEQLEQAGATIRLGHEEGTSRRGSSWW